MGTMVMLLLEPTAATTASTATSSSWRHLRENSSVFECSLPVFVRSLFWLNDHSYAYKSGWGEHRRRNGKRFPWPYLRHCLEPLSLIVALTF